MLYRKNEEETLDPELFRNPTSEYRGAPFWSWNSKLEKEELLRQIELFQEMGFGGFHMHVRTGMETPYLSEEFRDIVRLCVDTAKEKKLLAWLYDEDRWPSGSAGGLVTKNPEFRQRYLLFTATPYQENESNRIEISTAAAVRQGNGTLLAIYDIELNENGNLKSYKKIDSAEKAAHAVRYAYLEVAGNSPWYNNQAYVNTLDKKAMDRFIELTYNFYQDAVGEDFGKTVPAIFTDEPQFTHKKVLNFADGAVDVTLPWSDDLEKTFRDAYGDSLLEHLPELIWEKEDGSASVTRYRYHDHICERFTQAFADNCGAWCKQHGMMLTGHMMDEPRLHSQTKALGEAMRSYRAFELPGIDMLCNYVELTTAKQAQSAVHQYGREGMISELYGVTGWDFDFRGHKFQGDWQAALGVTVRVPHLSWYTMKGEAKRDYPATISYQSPWYKEYFAIEDHFARVATAMTRGTPDVRIGIIHPIESFWLHWGPEEQTADIREELEANFQNLTKWMLFGSIDFDFIAESLLPSLCKQAAAPLEVGEMKYDVILVPECETLRSTTLNCLEKFREAGGRLIFLGKRPGLENAEKSSRPGTLWEKSEQIPFCKSALMNALEAERSLKILTPSGKKTQNLLHQLRNDGTRKWLFIAHGTPAENPDISKAETIYIQIPGTWNVTEYQTLSGNIQQMKTTNRKGWTELSAELFDHDSLLLCFTPKGELPKGTTQAKTQMFHIQKNLSVPNRVPYLLGEPNACLLDTAEYALDDEPYRSEEEILRIDNILRKELGLPKRDGHVAQPWAEKREPATHQIRLRFRFRSEIRFNVPFLAMEDADKAEIRLNGKEIQNTDCGYYVDKAIRKVLLPYIKKGENILEVILPFGRNTNTEWMYLLGEFAVRLHGKEKILTQRPETVTFDSITEQGFPFYSGTFTYCCTAETSGTPFQIRLPRFRGAVNRIEIDGTEEGIIAFAPYQTKPISLPAGTHQIKIITYISRTNGFAPLHETDRNAFQEPNRWRSNGDHWTYRYNLYPEGLLDEPQFRELEIVEE